MRFEIAQPEVLYKTLVEINEGFRSKKSLVLASDDGCHRLEHLRLGSYPAPLPEPLESIRFVVHSSANNYSAAISITTQKPSCFNNLSDRFGAAFAVDKSPLIWIPVRSDGVGYITEKEPQADIRPQIVIAPSPNSQNPERIIAAGDFGARTKNIGDEDEFYQLLNGLQHIAGVYVNAIYKLNETDTSHLDNLVLTLDNII